jgi:hypothetical protein
MQDIVSRDRIKGDGGKKGNRIVALSSLIQFISPYRRKRDALIEIAYELSRTEESPATWQTATGQNRLTRGCYPGNAESPYPARASTTIYWDKVVS